MVDAYALTHALLHDAAKRGLRIFARTDVVRFTPRRGGWSIATDRGGTIRAQRVVIASGYEAHRVLRQKWGTLHSTYALATMPLPAFPGWPDSCLLWETAKPYFYARQTHDGRAVFGGYDEDFSDERRRDAMLTAKTAALLRKLRSLFPALDAETAYAWTGTFAETPDSLPYIGPVPGRPGMWAALGYGGNGVIFSTLARQIIREQMQEGRHPLEELFSFERPSRRSS